MSEPTLPIPDYVTPSSPSLGRTTARGFAWAAGQTLASKALNMGGQVVLAWLLRPQDFGLVGLAYTVTALATLIQTAGLREVLIQRQAKFDRWANAVFWMSLARGLLSALLMLAIAPIAAKLLHEPRLIGLIGILALTAPFQAAAVVSLARLQADLRFGASAGLAFGFGFLSMGLSVLLAWRGYGAYSFVLPTLVAAVVQVGVLWRLAPPPVRARLQLRRWRLLFTDSGLVLAAIFLNTLVMYGDNFVLGLVRSTEEVGVYFFAFNLSTQAVVVIMGNLSQVLFPSLTHIQNDVPRQVGSALRATRLMALVAIPLCLLQAAVAHPLIHAIYGPKWYAAIVPLEVLSLGLAFSIVCGPASNLFMSMGRFRLNLLLAAGSSCLFFVAVGLGAAKGAVVGVSIAVLIFYAIAGPVMLYSAIRCGGHGWGDVMVLIGIPVVCGAVAMGAAAGLAWLVPPVHAQHWLRLAITLTVGPLLYVCVVRFVARDLLLEVKGRIVQVFSRPG